MSTLQLRLNTSEREAKDPGWGKTYSALQLTHLEPLDEALWREPITGALMLRPSPFQAAWRETQQFEQDKLRAEDFHRREAFWETVYTRAGPSDPFLSLNYPLGAQAHEVALDTGLGLGGLSEGYGAGLVWALQSKRNLLLNQGWYLELRHLGYSYDRAADYLAVAFGKYALKIRTDGTALLCRYLPHDNEWQLATTMRFAGPSEQHGEGLSVCVLPILGNRLHFYFSSLQTVEGATACERLPSPRQTFHSFRLPRQEEVWDGQARVWRVVDEGPLRIAVSPGRRYFMQVGVVRFASTTKTAYLGHDDLGAPMAKPPKLVLHGYLPGSSRMEGLVLDAETGGVFAVGDSTKPRPRVRLRASSDAVWSPELHAVTLDFAPRIARVSREEWDVSGSVLHLRACLRSNLEAQTLEVSLRADGLTDLRAGTPCRLSLGGALVFRGELVSVEMRESLYGVTLHFVARDGWHRCEQVQAAPSPSFDGWLHTEVVSYLLSRVGVHQDEMDIRESDSTLPGGGQNSEHPEAIPMSPTANDWRFSPKPGDTVADMLRLVARRFAGWSLRHAGGAWQYRDISRASEPDFWLFARTSDYTASQLADSEKLRALRLRTMKLPARFNVLHVYGADGTVEGQRVMTYERNLSSIQDPHHEDYLGRAVEAHLTVPWASSVEACARVSRLAMRENAHSQKLCAFVTEWKPGLAPDSVVAVVDREGHPAGMYTLTEVVVETGGRFGRHIIARCMGERRSS